MLIQKNRKNKENSIYECDRCKTKLNNNSNHAIFVRDKEYNNVTKAWDLCDRCYKSLVKGIRNYKK